MQPSSRVMWKNGTFLTPQHFQQADRYVDSQLRLLQRAEGPLSWGVLDVRIDPIALTQGRLKLDGCQAFFPPPDGCTIDIPGTDVGPAERSLVIPDGVAAVEVFLTVPTQNAADRSQEREVALADAYNNTSVRKIKVAQKSLGLSLSGEPQKNLSVLKIAEIERDERTGKPTLRQSFAPPCLVVSAAPALQQLVRDLIGRMASLARTLPEARRLRQKDEFVMFLHAVTQHVAPLSHLIQEAAPLTHPAYLFEALLRLGAALSAFFDEPVPFPRYDHADPTPGFATLCKQIDTMLGFTKQPEDQVTVLRPKIEGGDNRIWLGKLPPGKPAANTPVFLALRGDIPATTAAKLIDELVKQGKIAPSSRITDFVAGFATAVPFRYATDLSPRQQAQPGIYYRLQTDDPLWDEICKGGEIAVYIPRSLRGDKLPTLEIIYVGSGVPR